MISDAQRANIRRARGCSLGREHRTERVTEAMDRPGHFEPRRALRALEPRSHDLVREPLSVVGRQDAIAKVPMLGERRGELARHRHLATLAALRRAGVS